MVVLPSSNVSPFIVSALLSLLLGGNHAGIEERQHLVVIAMPHHFENDGLAGLEFRNRAPVIGHAGNRLVVHFADDVTTGEANILGKARGLDFGDQDASTAFQADAAGALGSQFLDAQAELNRAGLAGLVIIAPGALGENLDAIFDRQSYLDRKSTRLNSSHLVISYAVFCLKKKKKKTHIQQSHSPKCRECTSYKHDCT